MIGAKVDAEEEENMIVDVGSIKLEEIMSSKIENFIKDPANRIKDNCPNLGDI